MPSDSAVAFTFPPCRRSVASITFRSTSCSGTTGAVKVIGDLTIRGKTTSVTTTLNVSLDDLAHDVAWCLLARPKFKLHVGLAPEPLPPLDRTAPGLLRVWSTSSIRTSHCPDWLRESAKLATAATSEPKCKGPLGEGAKRPR